MILVDTSVWIDHLRKADDKLIHLLIDGEVCTHPSIIEELACGSIARRSEVLGLLSAIPFVPISTHQEILDIIDREDLYSKGLSSVDVNLIASARLAAASIWTKDKALFREADRLGLGAIL